MLKILVEIESFYLFVASNIIQNVMEPPTIFNQKKNSVVDGKAVPTVLINQT